MLEKLNCDSKNVQSFVRFSQKGNEICKLRKSLYQKFNSDTKKANRPAAQPSTFSGIYVKNVPRRPKSPFRKYEKTALDSLAFSLRRPSIKKKSHHASASCLHSSSTEHSMTSGLFGRRVPIEQHQIKDKHYKPVNTFEDLVIACMEANPFVKENNLIYYKKKYLIDLTGLNSSGKTLQKAYSHSDISLGHQQSHKEPSDLTKVFLNNLAAESLILKKKIANGYDDLKTCKRLQDIQLIKQAYMDQKATKFLIEPLKNK